MRPEHGWTVLVPALIRLDLARLICGELAEPVVDNLVAFNESIVGDGQVLLGGDCPFSSPRPSDARNLSRSSAVLQPASRFFFAATLVVSSTFSPAANRVCCTMFLETS